MKKLFIFAIAFVSFCACTGTGNDTKAVQSEFEDTLSVVEDSVLTDTVVCDSAEVSVD